MNSNAVIRWCDEVIRATGNDHLKPRISNFLDYSDLVRDIIMSWPKAKRESVPRETLEDLRRLRDDFENIVRKDPMTIYTPAHHVALEFHQSQAKIRYNRSANRCAKTQTGIADNYYVLTGTHPWRPRPPLPAAVGVVILNFSKMIGSVYEPKYVTGEPGNPLSPIFPENGKWFYSYDAKKFQLKIACPDCAEKGKAGSCAHEKSTLIFFSTNEDEKVLQGAQFSQLHFDEQIPYPYFIEGMQRLTTVPNSGMIVTETAISGPGFWTNKILARDAKMKIKDNSGKIRVTLHTIGQREAGLIPVSEIEANERMMSEVEARARIYGEVAAFSESSVFDPTNLDMMRKSCIDGEKVKLFLPAELDKEKRLTEIQACSRPIKNDKVIAEPARESKTTIWENPLPYQQYVIGADVAYGLTGRDSSCASVMKITRVNQDFKFVQVAQIHGWINPRDYAVMLYKLGHYYNKATLVVERRGPGEETIRNLKDFSYINLFRDITTHAQVDFHAQSEFGLDTTSRSKPMIVASLQQSIRDGATGECHLQIFCSDTLDELGSYEQETTEKGNVQFHAQLGMHDDRVMAVGLAVYATKAFPYVYDYKAESNRRKYERDQNANSTDETKAFWRDVRKGIKEKARWKPSLL